MNFKNIFLSVDADGTLLTDDKRVSDKDRAAIREFTANGGLFTIATGRGVTLARSVAEEVGLEIPAVIFNGAAVYDFKNERFLWQCNLHAGCRGYIETLLARFPTLGVEVLRKDDVYVAATNRREEEHLTYGCQNPIRRELGEVPDGNWLKALLVDEPEVIDEVIEFSLSEKAGFTGVHMVRSAPVFYEMLPEGINKGSGIKRLLEIMGVRDRFTVAAGDYMNDIEMIAAADLGVAVANAHETVIQTVEKAAGLIVRDNNSGAISEIIERLKDINL